MRIGKYADIVIPVFLSIVYFVSARLSLQLAFAGSNASPVWPPTGLAIAALTFWGLRLAPAVTIAAFAANIVAFSATDSDLPLRYWIVSGGIALGNTAEALVGAYWLRRDREFPIIFHSQLSVLRFVLIALLVSAISAGIGTASLVGGGIIPDHIQTTVSLTWWIGDLCGALVFVPFIAAWNQGYRAAASLTPVATVHRFALSLLVIALISWTIFGNWITDPVLLRPLVFLVFPAISVIAWKYGLRGASSGLIVIATFAVIGTTRGFGPFSTGQLNDRLVLLGSFLALIAISALLLSSDRLERIREGFSDTLREYAPTGAALMGALAVTIFAWHLSSLENERRTERRFSQLATEVERQIADRIHEYQRVLRGGVGLFANGRTVERSDWHAYSEAIKLQTSLPGVQGIGFALRISGDARARQLKKAQAEGLADFTIKLTGIRDEYTPVIFLEPPNRRNQRALEFDMMSEPTRRKAMTHARDTGRTTITGMVTLQQEEEGNEVQPGFLMLEPTYRQGVEAASSDARQTGLTGFVFAAFRMQDLMQSIFGKRLPEIGLEIFDGASTHASQLLYSDLALKKVATDHPPRYTQERTLALFEHSWTLRVNSTPVFDAGIDLQKSQFVFVAGAIVSLLLFCMVRLQSLTIARASKLAQDMTADLRQTRLALEQREQFSSVIFESIPEPLLLVDNRGFMVRANGAAVRAFGRTQEELAKLTVETLVPVEFRDRHPTLRKRFALGTESRPMGIELRAERADGSTFPVEIASASLAFDAEKFVIVSIVDITAHKAAESELRKLSSLNIAILDSAAVSIISTTPDGIITSFNSGAEMLLGYRADEMVLRCSPTIIHDPNEVAARAAEFSQEIGHPIEPGFEVLVAKSRQDLSNTHEWTYIDKNGKQIPVLLAVTALRDNQQAITGFLGIAVDISKRKNAEAALREKEHFLRSITDNVPALIGYWDVKQECRFANRAYMEWFGKTNEEIIGISKRQLLGEAAYLTDLPHIEGALRGNEQHFDRTLLRADGTRHTLITHYIPNSVGGIVDGFFALIVDITELTQTKLALEARSLEAEAASRAKGDFLANMSHEIRTPMNAVIGLSYLLQDTSLDTKQRNYVDRIRNASKALLSILNDILDYSKIEAGHLDIENLDFRLEDTLKETSDLFSFICSEKNLELFFEIAPNVPQMVVGDSLRLSQVLHNLIGNAVKFTAHGEIHIMIDAEQTGLGSLRLNITVRDTGIGMTTEQINRLFQPFEQADATTTRKYGGTGLGLSICKRLVELMGGDISVVSEPDVGSTFRFNIKVQIGTIPEPKHSPEVRHMRILVVDDQATSLIVLEQMLRAWECNVTVANNGLDALRLIADTAAAGSPFELMLLDWKMPGMDGLELARRCDTLAKQGGLPFAPRIVMVTAHGRNQLAMAIADTPIDAILEKPILPSQLFDTIVNLRLGQDTSAARAVAREPHWSSLTVAIRGARILLVEDNKTNQLVAREFLHAMGMVVELADDGMEAVEKVRQGKFDLVLMDLQMPLMDGFEAVREIRKTERGRDLPIVAMTAAAMAKDKQATEAAGMNDHISKPIDPELLAKSLLDWLPQRITPVSGTEHHQNSGDEGPFELPGLDLVSALQSLGNSWSLVRKVCVGFVQNFSDANEQLERFLQCDDFAEAIRLVHTIKGLALNVGALDLERVARQFEHELNGRETSGRAEFENTLATTLGALAALHDRDFGEHATTGQTAVDAARSLPQLREFETMLQKKQGKARHLAKDIDAMLTNTALQSSFKVILSKTERLQFDDALRLLRDLLNQHFSDAV